MLIILAGLLIVCAIFVPNFANPLNAESLLLQVSTVGLVSSTMLFCLASGNFDLSVGSLIPAGGVLCALIIRHSNSVILGVGGALLFGLIVGWFNGVIIAKAKINALITTLSTLMIVRGLAYVFADGKSIGVANEAFSELGNWAFPVFYRSGSSQVLFEMSTPVWLCFACFIGFGFILRRTIFGRSTLAIGGNEEAARLAGLPVDRVKIVIFAVQGAVASLAGVLLTARMGIGDPKVAQGSELSIIAACVLGGVSLSGGIGKMSFVVAGVFIMGIVENAMNLLSIDSFYQYIVRGAILLCAVLFDRFRKH
jgi:L-arabinose transport system permease protein